jgi:hypothetical protein
VKSVPDRFLPATYRLKAYIVIYFGKPLSRETKPGRVKHLYEQKKDMTKFRTESKNSTHFSIAAISSLRYFAAKFNGFFVTRKSRPQRLHRLPLHRKNDILFYF